MGNYINKMPDGTDLGWGKADWIAMLPDVQELEAMPFSIKDVPFGKIVVCVARNAGFEAALICDTEHDVLRVHRSIDRGDMRPKRYFLLDRDDVRKMADEQLESEQ